MLLALSKELNCVSIIFCCWNWGISFQSREAKTRLPFPALNQSSPITFFCLLVWCLMYWTKKFASEIWIWLQPSSKMIWYASCATEISDSYLGTHFRNPPSSWRLCKKHGEGDIHPPFQAFQLPGINQSDENVITKNQIIREHVLMLLWH